MCVCLCLCVCVFARANTCVRVCVCGLLTGSSMSSSFVFSLTFSFTGPFSFPVFINSYAGYCGDVFRSPARTIAFVPLCWETWSMYWKARPACRNTVRPIQYPELYPGSLPKKVQRKRHNARHVASTRCAALSPRGRGGGGTYPGWGEPTLARGYPEG